MYKLSVKVCPYQIYSRHTILSLLRVAADSSWKPTAGKIQALQSVSTQSKCQYLLHTCTCKIFRWAYVRVHAPHSTADCLCLQIVLRHYQIIAWSIRHWFHLCFAYDSWNNGLLKPCRSCNICTCGCKSPLHVYVCTCNMCRMLTMTES